ncbi:MAG: Hsp20/alpha crystallin family protein [Promethearchaeota archaeon]
MSESIVEKKNEAIEEKKEEKEEKIKYRIRPTRYFSFDAEKKEWELEIHLPGVKKADIKFRVLPNLYDLKAQRGEALYSLTQYFPWDIDTNSVKANYENGLLIVNGKIRDPMADAVSIKLE